MRIVTESGSLVNSGLITEMWVKKEFSDQGRNVYVVVLTDCTGRVHRSANRWGDKVHAEKEAAKIAEGW